MEILVTIVIIAIIMAIAVWLFIAKQGDADFEFKVNERTEFKLVDQTEKTATFSCEVAFINKGSQDGTIMDAYPRHLLPYEQFDGVDVNSRMELTTALRTDNYFEAVIIPKGTGGIVIVTVTFTAKTGNIKDALQNLYDLSVDMPIDIVYQIVARTPWYIHKARMIMSCDEINRAMQAKGTAKWEG
ncbi:hypothetical protein SAMN04515679_1671 [Pelosinus fermentans]|uniref:Uncharacterized protein n=1 Tax=Pelosinus fermentans B4 TaxID=1149862 RepID=I9LK07_9FIRM|nr:hypothetical protein [Pelosinus fermentans]EIW20834.1 hypothetical protein FB4_2046 [Pelosinus fermentans B4]EIW25321.1 hypothetical protein FA11_2480 [Pelosinus fermentans A11]OAM93579.1 hypothetical protein FR7_01596 [Pelosinus fermentans DSM 17108]SDQ82740.1 hypothetical protein SAMN04515679_1671 [Pelosinus fermentans]